MLNAPEWDMDVACAQNGYFVTSSPKEFTSHSTPVLFIAATLYNEWQYITQKRKDEISAFWMTKELGDGLPHYLAYDFVIPKQEVTPTLTSIDGESLKEITTRLKPLFPNNGMHKYLTHAHLHPNMGVGWSGTDLTQQNTKGELGFESDYRIYVVTNSNMEIHASFVMYKPVFFRVENVTVGIYTGDKYAAVPLAKERKAELDLLVSDNIKPIYAKHLTDWPHAPDRDNWLYALDRDKPLAVNNAIKSLDGLKPATVIDPGILEIIADRQLAAKITALSEQFPSINGSPAEDVLTAIKEGLFDDGPLETMEDFISEVFVYV